jgi:hypothetical protein
MALHAIETTIADSKFYDNFQFSYKALNEYGLDLNFPSANGQFSPPKAIEPKFFLKEDLQAISCSVSILFVVNGGTNALYVLKSDQ